MIKSRWFLVTSILLLTLLLARRADGQASDPIQYKLYPGSVLEYGCFDACACPIFSSGPLRGTFTFYRTSVDPMFTHYAMVNIDWAYAMGDSGGGMRIVHLTGQGTYELGGEFAIAHRMTLDLKSDGGLEQHFDSGLAPTHAIFPAIDIEVRAHHGVCLDTLIHVVAAPPGYAEVHSIIGVRLIERAMPNPTREALDVVLAIPQAEHVRADVIDVSGRLVATLADRELPAGEQQLHWDGRSAIGANAGAGLYWIRVRAGAQHDTQRIVRFR